MSFIDGRKLRGELGKYPLGTQFLCVGHWDINPYYKSGVVYEVTYLSGEELFIDEEGEVTQKILRALGRSEVPGNKTGNGYSGIWRLVGSDKEIDLGDYL